MTAKRKDNGELEVIHIGGQTFTYRTLLLLLVASVTPIGDSIWAKLGFTRDPIIPGIARVEKQLNLVKLDIQNIHDDLDMVTTRFNKFDVDFRNTTKKQHE